jgi:hypothetical protein
VDLTALDADRARLERDVKFCKDDDPQLGLLKKNLAIILKRQDKMREIRRYLDVARGQLDLIENSFQLIADQIVTMQSPEALRPARRALDGVETIRQTAGRRTRCSKRSVRWQLRIEESRRVEPNPESRILNPESRYV